MKKYNNNVCCYKTKENKEGNKNPLKVFFVFFLLSINVDVVSSKNGCSTMGKLTRNCSGQLCVVKAIAVGQILSPLKVEQLAIKEALIWFWNNNFTKGEIITNSKLQLTQFFQMVAILDQKVFWQRTFCSLLIWNYDVFYFIRHRV